MLGLTPDAARAPIPVDPPAGQPRAPDKSPLLLKVLLADERELLIEGYRSVVRGLAPRVQMIDASTPAFLLEQCRLHTDVDLVLVDESLIDRHVGASLAVLRALCPLARIVLVVGDCDPAFERRALTQGAHGCVSRRVSSRALADALRLVLDGRVYVTSEALDAGASPAAVPSNAPFHYPEPPRPSRRLNDRLTDRQIEVLQEIVRGRSNKEICRELGLAMGTVKSHLSAIFLALQVCSRTAAVAEVERMGWRDQLRAHRSAALSEVRTSEQPL